MQNAQIHKLFKLTTESSLKAGYYAINVECESQFSYTVARPVTQRYLHTHNAASISEQIIHLKKTNDINVQRQLAVIGFEAPPMHSHRSRGLKVSHYQSCSAELKIAHWPTVGFPP